MNRIQQVFENKKAFIPFITAGDPDLSVDRGPCAGHGRGRSGFD